MYIPTSTFPEAVAARGLWGGSGAEEGVTADAGLGLGLGHGGSALSQLAAGLRRVFFASVSSDGPAGGGDLRRRDNNDSNLTVGIIVGVVLGLFLVGCFAFIWFYRKSIKISQKKHKKRKKSGSSKSSKSSGDSPPGSPAAPPPAEPA